MDLRAFAFQTAWWAHTLIEFLQFRTPLFVQSSSGPGCPSHLFFNNFPDPGSVSLHINCAFTFDHQCPVNNAILYLSLTARPVFATMQRLCTYLSLFVFAPFPHFMHTNAGPSCVFVATCSHLATLLTWKLFFSCFRSSRFSMSSRFRYLLEPGKQTRLKGLNCGELMLPWARGYPKVVCFGFVDQTRACCQFIISHCFCRSDTTLQIGNTHEYSVACPVQVALWLSFLGPPWCQWCSDWSALGRSAAVASGCDCVSHVSGWLPSVRVWQGGTMLAKMIIIAGADKLENPLEK